VVFSAVLDANVLYPFSLRDTLLRLAELELFTPLWSTRILAEMTRNLVEHRITEEQVARIEQAMRQAFEEAEVDPEEIERLEPAMTNDPKDRHVLAAAVAADSELIVTFDISDFPPRPASRSASKPPTQTTSCSTSTTSTPKPSEPRLNNRPPTSTHRGHLTSSYAHSPPQVSPASPTPSAHSASLALPMPQLPDETMNAQPCPQRTLADRPRGLRPPALLGLGSGDRFEAFRGGSGSFKGRVQQAEKPSELQGKRSTKRGSRIT
jgi:predicted nucleic acid-binding protein